MLSQISTLYLVTMRVHSRVTHKAPRSSVVLEWNRVQNILLSLSGKPVDIGTAKNHLVLDKKVSD